ncbi:MULTISPECIES: TlpA disulfide reductase family protein [unclassified Spirosoma]|uniref:TlpA disulfide reductase family protein n=1 Tax=unclassified Spirosoma TaxID=2621999 RepID=UPI00095B3E72|nr:MULTISPECIES: TlpA disulfide reductase family protein [unclassified Spirosoma]MBN8822540.1 TlpA family protein disulfide reductase [Spirosoma sp.]OJW74038.1 MAG: alkyl hydroperoxide reductase [Spirosoma sp. 48-14]
MKLIASLFALCLICCLSASAQLCFSPERPQIGQIVSFTYTPSATLAQDSTLEGRFVRYGAPTMMRISQPTTVTLVRQGSNYVGELYIPKKDVAGTMLYFRNSKQPNRTDLSNGQFYVVLVCDSTGRIVPHATGGQASVFSRSHFLNETGIRADPNWVVTLYEHELAMNPDLRPLYWSDHLAALIKQRKPGYGPKVKAAIEAYLASRPTPTVAELADASRLYESMGDFQKVAALRERQKTTDPAGLLMQKDRAIAIRNEADWSRKKAAYEAFLKDYPTSAHLPDLAAVMLNSYFKNNDIKGLIAFAEKQPAAQTDVMVLNTIANQLAEERRSLPEAELLIKHGLAVLNSQTKPRNAASAWEADKQTRFRQLTNTYARTLDQQKKDTEAFALYQSVVNPDDVENSDPRTTERYFLCALRTNHAAEALPMVEAAIQAGKATPSLKNILRDWYAKQPGNDPGKAKAYLANLESDIKADQRDELLQKLINEPAPAFTMTDLQGRTISSSAFKGKVVVLDFWATWCGPCIASFPAMQQAKNQFQDDPSVRFLFVNTREGGPLSRVHAFMEKHPYDFTVPIDGQQKVSKAYKVLGIPTKVVIGPNGRVRYRTIGYSGDPEATVNELALVVELLKEGK